MFVVIDYDRINDLLKEFQRNEYILNREEIERSVSEMIHVRDSHSPELVIAVIILYRGIRNATYETRVKLEDYPELSDSLTLANSLAEKYKLDLT